MATFGGQSAVRGNVLADMGIQVWGLRRGSEAPTDTLMDTSIDTQQAAETPQAIPVPSPSEPAATAAAPVPIADQSPQDAVVAEAPSATPDVAAICLVAEQVVMLVDDCPLDQRRLMLDIFAAAAGQRAPAGHQELRFRWDGDAAAQWRAFGAFVDKQLVDHEPQFMLCSEGLCDHLPERTEQPALIVLPALVELGKRVELKRELWRQIQSHQS